MVSGSHRSRLRDALSALPLEGTPLEQICQACVALLGVTGAAAVLMSDDESGARVAASNTGAAQIEDLQFTLGQGPCLRAFRTSLPVIVPELLGTDASSWPEFAEQAVKAGARAVFALPLCLGTIRLGVLYLYRSTPGPLTDEQLTDALGLADFTTAEVLTSQSGSEPEELGRELGGGWTRRAIVHAATGMAAAQLDTDLAEALARIRQHAAAEGRSIYSVAADVVERRLRFEP